ncbi:HTH-type transcriptional activator HxlR domain protein [Clostridium sp. ATCC 29733]|nr:HTH-type transcriptional activator HxlR domain protein [Clostridium sp. ATCC 29733]
MLSSQPKELEHDSLVIRREYSQIPPKVEYSLFRRGHSLIPILIVLSDRGADHLPENWGRLLRTLLGDRLALPVVKSIDSKLGKPAFFKMATKSKQTQPVQSALICLLPALMGVPYANQAHSTSLIDFLQASTLTSKA